MGWALNYIAQLQAGETISFCPRGNSMTGKISSGDRCTVRPFLDDETPKVDDIVLCKVNGREYLHLIKAVRADQFQIGNNKGLINGWTPRKNIYGLVTRVEGK